MEGLGLGDPLQKAISSPLFLLSLRGHWFHQWEAGGAWSGGGNLTNCDLVSIGPQINGPWLFQLPSVLRVSQLYL